MLCNFIMSLNGNYDRSKLSRRGEAVLVSLFLRLGDFINMENCLKSKCTLNYLRDAAQTKTVTDDELKEALTKFGFM